MAVSVLILSVHTFTRTFLVTSWCSVWSLSIFIFRFSRIQWTYNPQFSLKVGTLKEEEQIS